MVRRPSAAYHATSQMMKSDRPADVLSYGDSLARVIFDDELPFLIEEWSADRQRRFRTLARTIDYELALAVFEAALKTGDKTRVLMLKNRTRLIKVSRRGW